MLQISSIFFCIGNENKAVRSVTLRIIMLLKLT